MTQTETMKSIAGYLLLKYPEKKVDISKVESVGKPICTLKVSFWQKIKFYFDEQGELDIESKPSRSATALGMGFLGALVVGITQNEDCVTEAWLDLNQALGKASQNEMDGYERAYTVAKPYYKSNGTMGVLRGLINMILFILYFVLLRSFEMTSDEMLKLFLCVVILAIVVNLAISAKVRKNRREAARAAV